MKAQLKVTVPGTSSRVASPRRSEPTRPVAPQIRAECVEKARRRLASGYYDSDVCLDITVRRLVRSLKRPAPTVVIVPPGRSAEQRSRKGKP